MSCRLAAAPLGGHPGHGRVGTRARLAGAGELLVRVARHGGIECWNVVCIEGMGGVRGARELESEVGMGGEERLDLGFYTPRGVLWLTTHVIA